MGGNAAKPVQRGHLAAMLAVAALALGLYVQGAAPSVLWGDSAEMQSVANLGGVAHPTGYPSFILIGRLFARLPLGDPARRITMMSSFFGAASLAMIVLLLAELEVAPAAAFAGALLFGLTYTFWTSALRAEVYTLSVFLMLVASWRTVVALRRGGFGSILLAGLLLGVAATGHLMFGVPIAVLGLCLAWRTVRLRPQQSLSSLALLLGAFLIGLTPYLYLLWADTRPGPMPFDYLRLVDRASNPLGHHDPNFDTPWKRLWWLFVGRNELPPKPPPLSFVSVTRTLIFASFVLTLFELGPLATLFAIAGVGRQWRRNRGLAVGLVCLALLSTLFAGVVEAGAMMGTFLMPCTLAVTFLAAVGLEPALRALARPMGGGPLPRWSLALLVPAMLNLPAQGLRLYSYDHPLTRWRFQVREEDAHRMTSWVPAENRYWEPLRFGEAAMAAIPPGALVVAGWRELENLGYFRWVLGRRPDLELQPMSYPTLHAALGRWRETHDLERRPIVYVTNPPELEPFVGPLDSLRIGTGAWIWVERRRATR